LPQIIRDIIMAILAAILLTIAGIQFWERYGPMFVASRQLR
jgi:hypothetical protein